MNFFTIIGIFVVISVIIGALIWAEKKWSWFAKLLTWIKGLKK